MKIGYPQPSNFCHLAHYRYGFVQCQEKNVVAPKKNLVASGKTLKTVATRIVLVNAKSMRIQ